MADSSLSSDLEHEPSPPRAKQKAVPQVHSVPPSHTSRKSKSSLSADKDALRRHKALERQFDKARQAAATSVFAPDRPTTPHGFPSVDPEASSAGLSAPPHDGDPSVTAGPSGGSHGLSKKTSLSLPDVSSVGLAKSILPLPRQPEVTFTPTAAGLHALECQLPTSQMGFQALLIYCAVFLTGRRAPTVLSSAAPSPMDATSSSATPSPVGTASASSFESASFPITRQSGV